MFLFQFNATETIQKLSAGSGGFIFIYVCYQVKLLEISKYYTYDVSDHHNIHVLHNMSLQFTFKE